MSQYVFLDKASLISSAIYLFSSKYFRESVESEKLKEHLDNTQIEFPENPDKRFQELRAKTLVGDLFPAFRIAQWKSDNFPTIIYHHNGAEEPYDYSFKKIFPIDMLKMPVNFIIVRGPLGARARLYYKGIRSLRNYTAMLAVSVNLTEHLIDMVRKIGSQHITVAGLSLGGYITNIHHTYFNSADCYKPCLAGVEIEEDLFAAQHLRLMSPLALQNRLKVKEVLSIQTDFNQIDHNKLYPLLARYDQVVDLAKQGQYYPQENMTIIDKGHATWALALRPIREHLLKGI